MGRVFEIHRWDGGPRRLDPGLEDSTHPTKSAKTNRTDLHGDPLPEQAAARLGTSQLRTGSHHLFLPDGKFVQSREDGGLQISAVPSGKPLARIRATDVPERGYIVVSTAAASPDSKYLAAVCWEGRCGIWETATGRLVRWLESGRFYSIVMCDFSPDGKLLAVGGTPDNKRFDAFTLDGNTLFAAGPEGGTIRLLDACTGKSERTFPAFTKSLAGPSLTRDGERLIAAGRDGDADNSLVRILDAATGAKLREWGASAAKVEQLTVRPDGESVATSHAGRRVVAWNAAGKKVLEKAGRSERVSVQERGGGVGFTTPYRIGPVGLSPDGRRLAYSDQEQGIVIVNVPSGNEAGRVKPDLLFQSPSIRDDVRDVLAFSPDGQTIAWSGVESTADIFLVEVRTAGVRGRRPGESTPVQHLAFSPDGSRLLSAGPDGSVLLWDLTGRHAPKTAPGKPLTPAELESCWSDLVGEDARRAYQAIRKLIASPAEAVAFLSQHLEPLAAPDAKHLEKLIADLDGEAFATREQATTELTKLGPLAESALRKAIDESPSAEARRRVEQRLARLENLGSTGEPLRAYRAIEALEHIATPEARRLLTKLAAGAPLTREAKAALERLTTGATRKN